MGTSGFNPKARWDRHIPQDSDESFDPAQINEKIQVLAFFKDALIYPRSFTWNNKDYLITKITYNWQERQGQEMIHYFSVSSGIELYQISFNNTTLSWRINKIIS
jgi:hypothetical protein